MSNWRLNWNVIRPDLIVGSCPRKVADLMVLQKNTGATALLSLQHDECLEKQEIDYPRHVHYGQRLGLTLARVPMRDFNVDDQRRGLPDAVRALSRLLQQGCRVYVHCTAGLNRAPLVVSAYLLLVEGLSQDAIFELWQHTRPNVFPAWAAIQGCCADLTTQYADRIRQRVTELGGGSAPLIDADVWRQAEQAIWREVLTTEPDGA